MLVLIKGAGDLASGVALRLHRAGFKIIMTDIANPTVIRRTVSFADAVYNGETMVEDVRGVVAKSTLEAFMIMAKGDIPVLIDPEANILNENKFDVVVDAILAKVNYGTKITDAPIVIALGPGFNASVDCHAVIETQRGHNLGRVIYEGSASPNTGIPGNVGGYALERLVKAPTAGVFTPIAKIGDVVEANALLGHVNGVEVRGQITGVLRGILMTGLEVHEGMKIGDIDPRCEVNHCFSVSDKARSLGGAVLEGILHLKEGI